MSRIFLLLFVVLGCAFLYPRTRAHLLPLVEFATRPAARLNTRDKVERIGRYVQVQSARTGEPPSPREFRQYLRAMFPGREDAVLDSWGTPYQLRRRLGAYVVVSAGPDRRTGTADDIASKPFQLHTRPALPTGL